MVLQLQHVKDSTQSLADWAVNDYLLGKDSPHRDWSTDEVTKVCMYTYCHYVAILVAFASVNESLSHDIRKIIKPCNCIL
jgi:hypothetical protein